jgi:hypothetical protein
MSAELEHKGPPPRGSLKPNLPLVLELYNLALEVSPRTNDSIWGRAGRHMRLPFVFSKAVTELVSAYEQNKDELAISLNKFAHGTPFQVDWISFGEDHDEYFTPQLFDMELHLKEAGCSIPEYDPRYDSNIRPNHQIGLRLKYIPTDYQEVMAASLKGKNPSVVLEQLSHSPFNYLDIFTLPKIRNLSLATPQHPHGRVEVGFTTGFSLTRIERSGDVNVRSLVYLPEHLLENPNEDGRFTSGTNVQAKPGKFFEDLKEEIIGYKNSHFLSSRRSTRRLP